MQPGTVIPKEMKARVGALVNPTLMMEEYLDGDEVDCDIVLSNGVCTYGAITDNW